MYEADEMDLQILRALQVDGRIPITQLSTQLAVPHTTLRDRIRRMEEAGVIEGYSARINPEKLGWSICGYTLIRLDQRVETGLAVEALEQIPEVTEIFLLTGEIDAFVKIWAKDMQHLYEILYQKFNQVPGMVRMSTALVLTEKIKPGRAPIY